MSTRVAVRVTKDALRHVRAGHPWVYSNSVTSVSPPGEAGDLAVVFDDRRRFAAIGLWDPDSPIAVRLVHRGRPQTIDRDFWCRRIGESIARRSRFTDAVDADRSAYRLVHGENDGLPGLVVDRYPGVLVVKIYTAGWIPHLDDVLVCLEQLTGVSTVVLRAARVVQRSRSWVEAGLRDGAVIRGALEADLVQFEENGSRFAADVRRGQKTGHFLDQRANRARLMTYTEGRSVLDVFASTGGFTVHAAAGGARSVTSIDISAPTLAMARRNVELNPSLGRTNFDFVVGDAFAEMERLRSRGRSFDVVVVDPPSFASGREDVPRAERAYGRLTRLALGLLTKRGMLLQASCTARIAPDRFVEVVETAARVHGRAIRLRALTGHDTDHPVGFPEGEYLKAGFWTV